MNIGTRIDLQTIYDNQIIPTELFNQFVQVLEHLETTYSQRATLRTRNTDNKILGSSSIKYFTFDELSNKIEPYEVIFAGSMEKPPRGNKSPIVRVRNANPHLGRIPLSEKFPFTRARNPEWTSVIVSSNTIDLLKELLQSEAENYFSS